jgi:uncharacterized protein YciI
MKQLILIILLLFGLSGASSAAAQTAPSAQPSQPTPAKHQFFLKLIPPRPTFATDMTPEEMKLMQQHADYWASQFPNGIVLLIGPVFHANGSFGMAVLETATEEEARTLANNDPTVKAGLNKVEISPMHVFYIKK